VIDERLVSDEGRARCQAAVRELMRDQAPASWRVMAKESEEARAQRAAVLWTLGYVGGDAEVMKEARAVAETAIRHPESVDGALADDRAEGADVVAQRPRRARLVLRQRRARRRRRLLRQESPRRRGARSAPLARGDRHVRRVPRRSGAGAGGVAGAVPRRRHE